jgi:hypothetical protein
VAALLLQYNSTLTPAQIYAALRSTASAMGAVPNLNAGYGFIQADKAIQAVPAGTAPPATGGGGHGGGGLDSVTLLALACLLGLRFLVPARRSRRALPRAPLPRSRRER